MACGKAAVPDPKPALDAYARAAQAGDADALYAMMSERSRRELGPEGARRVVNDAKADLGELGAAAGDPASRVVAIARVRFADGEEARLPLEGGAFRVAAAGGLPAAARTPADALAELRRALARRSYAGLMRVLSKETRAAIERDLAGLVDGLGHPETLDVKIVGDRASVELAGGHKVRMRRENGLWVVEDFD
jgi:hypothetical protein